MRGFPYGAAAFSILILALASGAWLGVHPVPRKTATLTYWTFANTHYDAYRKLLPGWEAAHPGKTVDLQLVNNQATPARLQSAFWADLDVPDLAEIEISSAGSFFRGPVKDIGFIDLKPRLINSGMWNRIVHARLAPYTHRGHIYGLPHDVHPVMLAYRRDIFEQNHVDVNKIKTWDDFIRVGRRLTIPGQRYMIELPDSSAEQLEVCLFQRGGGYFDADGNVIFDNDAAVKTMMWYVPLVAGPNKIGSDLGGSDQIVTQAVESGYVLCLLTPDWRSKMLENNIPRMAGKMALMPLPAVTPGGIRTSTRGGTMVGITKRCKAPDLAWDLVMHFYLDKQSLPDRYRATNILPPVKDMWKEPVFHEKRAYWSGQRIGELYAALAPEVPFQYTSPFITTAKSKLSEALVSCVQHYKQHGDAGFEQFVRQQLKTNADQVRRLIKRNPY